MPVGGGDGMEGEGMGWDWIGLDWIGCRIPAYSDEVMQAGEAWAGRKRAERDESLWWIGLDWFSLILGFPVDRVGR